MDKVKFLFFVIGFSFPIAIGIVGCNVKPDVTKEVKTIDSLKQELEKTLADCKAMDTTWVNPITEKAANNVKMLKKVYDPDSIDSQLAQKVTYYKGYRKFGRRFVGDRMVFIKEFQKSLSQLENLKTDAENGALKTEELNKYLNEEKLVTTDLLYKYKEFKASTEMLLKKFDSLNPMIENLIEVYRPAYEAMEEKRKKSGITIH